MSQGDGRLGGGQWGGGGGRGEGKSGGGGGGGEGTTHYRAQLGLPDKGRVIKGLVICFVVRLGYIYKWEGS